MNTQTTKARKIATSVYTALFGDFPREQMSWSRVRFADPKTEHEYQIALVENELPKDRLVNYLGILVYVAFGVLDFLTFDEQLPQVLALRLGLCAPFALILISLTFLDKFKPHFQTVTALVMLTGSLSMVVMIGMMEPEGGPPYIIGILVVLIFYSCMQRLSFPVAMSIFLAIFVAYSATIIFISPKSASMIASGHFFMVTITLTAVFTCFMQEARSRIDYSRKRQREIDASFIEKLLIEATASDRAKNSFLSVLSHELRTPLHQIVGFSEIVKNQATSEPSADTNMYLDEIHSSASRLLGSIGKMLRYADATAGKMTYDIDDCSVEYLIETVVEQTRSKADTAKITLDIGDLTDAVLSIDHLNTGYAVAQLLDNAIVASEPDTSIAISAERDADGGVILRIKDEGSGMSAEQISTAFAPFTQTEDFNTRSMEGIGLGLSLSQKVLNDQKATLDLESIVGTGTTAIIRFKEKHKTVSAAASQNTECERNAQSGLT